MTDTTGFFNDNRSLSSEIPAFSFADRRCIGVPRGGDIMEDPVRVQQRNFDTQKPEFWEDGPLKGTEKWALIVLLQTQEREPGVPTDTGLRRLFIPNNGNVPGSMYRVVGDAIKQTGESDLRTGGRLMVAWIGEEPSSRKGGNPRKIWAAQYTAPVSSGQYFQQPNGHAGPPVPQPFDSGEKYDAYANDPFRSAQQQPQFAGAPQATQGLPAEPWTSQVAGQPNGPQPQPQYAQQGAPAMVQQAAGYVASADAGQPPVGPQNMPTPWATGQPQQAAQQGQWQPGSQEQQAAAAHGLSATQQQPQPQAQNPFAGQQQTYQPLPFDPANPFGNAPAQQQQPQRLPERPQPDNPNLQYPQQVQNPFA